MTTRVFLLAMLAIACVLGCSKQKSETDSQPKSVDLGVVDLTLNSPVRKDLGGGDVCVFTAMPMDRTSIELISSLEKDSKQIASARTLPVAIGQPMDVSLGNYQLRLIPKVTQ